MTSSTDTRNAARNRAQTHFKSSEQRENVRREEMAKERAAMDAKTARLRALRLAKEAEDKVEDERLAAEEAEKKRRNSAAKTARKPAARSA